ncbi:MAG: ABC transporter ATP-binding protein [Candidatus Odinarchaeota archaeon]
MAIKISKDAYAYQLSALSKYPLLTAICVGLAVFAAYLTALPGIIIGDAVDILNEQQALTPGFVSSCVLILFVAILLFLSLYSVGYAFAHMTWRWYRDAIQAFFDHVQNKSMTFHDQVNSKKLLAMAMQDIQWVRFSLNPALRILITAISSLFITTVILFGIDPVLGAIMAIGTPVYLYFAYRYAMSIEPVRRSRSEQNEELTSISQEVFSGIEVVKSFGTEKVESSKFSRVSKIYEELTAREGRLAAFYIPVLVLSVITSLCFVYAAYQILSGTYPVGTLAKVIGLLVAVDSFSLMVPRFLLVLRGAHVNAQRIIDLLNYEDPFEEPTDPVKAVNGKSDIIFENVNFNYSNNGKSGSLALNNLNIVIPAGSRVALIGGPGSGKSTFLKLLLRLYDPISGRILINGVDLKTVSTKAVRKSIGLVEQDIFLFRKSIRENIKFGNSGATEENIIEAAKRAQAHEFIDNLPMKYDTVIGERGMTISGGQRQRIAIARTILHDPKILLLDDSVSAIDAKTEFFLRKALDEVMQERTSITVTQRLRTLLESDLIVILEKGKLVASGSHNELIQSSKHYQRIFERLPGALQYLVTRQKQTTEVH